MDMVLDLHGRLATALIMYLVALGVWGAVLGLRGSGPTGSYNGALVIAEVAIVAQGVLGVIAFPSRPPANIVHLLYGAALVLALPLAATYVRGRPPRRAAFTFAATALFAAGLAARGMTTS